MRHLFGTIILLITVNAYAQIGIQSEDWSKVKNENFKALLADLKIDFTIPKNFSEVKLVENTNVLYHKAYKHNSSGFELRIWIRDIRNEKIPEGLSPDQFSKSFITMVSLNASGYVLPNVPEVMVFDSSTSNTEFNADWVANTAFLSRLNGFNKGFEVCSILGMRKNELAEVYVFFMIADRVKETYLVDDLAQVVKFN